MDFTQPIVDINTSNTSALKMYHILKDLGIENRSFFLTLCDPGLSGVDPYSPDLSQEMKMRIHAECVRNPWYFVRELLKLDVPGGSIPYQLNRGALAIFYLLSHNINLHVEMPRQTGKTTAITAYIAYVWSFKCINSRFMLFNKSPDSACDNLEDVKRVIRNLPPYLQMMDEKKDRSSQEILASHDTQNTITVYGAPANEHQARNRGRGSRSQYQYFDEHAHFKFFETVYLNSAPAWKTAADIAKSNGNPYCRIFSSTPGFLGSDEEANYVFYDFIPQCIPFDEKLFYDTDPDKLVELVYNQSKNDIVYIRFTYAQLGKSKQWLSDQLRNMGNNIDNFTREVLLVWARRNQDSPFTKEQLDRAYKGIRSPIGSVAIQNAYALRVYRKPDFTKRHIISVDCSGMLGNDYSSICVTDVETFEPVATLRSNARTSYSNTRIFSQAIGDVATMFPNALIVIERNSMGIAVIDNVINDFPQLIPRMYSSDLEPETKTDNVDGFVFDEARNSKLDRDTIPYGFVTNKPRRMQMMSEILGIIINELYDLVNDKDIFDELNNIVKKNGRIDHKDGKHDDMLMAWCIGLWVLCYSKILESKYGFEFGCVRPMSIAMSGDTEIKKKQLATTIDNMNNIANLAIQTAKMSNGELMYSEPLDAGFNPHRRESWDDTGEFSKNMSYHEIGNLIFGEHNSIIDPHMASKIQAFDEPVIEAGFNEELSGISDMAKDKADAKRMSAETDLMRLINDAKNSYMKDQTPYLHHRENRRNAVKNAVEAEKPVQEFKAIDSLIDSFIENDSF
jgi:hypothetical protein